METSYRCPVCDESRNFQFVYDYAQAHRPVKDVWCRECGTTFDGNMPVAEPTTKPGFVERRMAQMQAINDRKWNDIYDSYRGTSDLHDFIDWLKQNYVSPKNIVT